MSKQSRDALLFVEDILNAFHRIEKYTKNTSLNEFRKNDMAIDAVIRNFEVIGEAGNNIPKSIRDKYPNVEWKETISFRNVLIHDYFGIDVEAVWDTIKRNLPSLKKHINELLKNEDIS